MVRLDIPRVAYRFNEPGRLAGITLDKGIEQEFTWLVDLMGRCEITYQGGETCQFIDKAHPLAQQFDGEKVRYWITLSEFTARSFQVLAVNETPQKEVIAGIAKYDNSGGEIWLLPSFKCDDELLRIIDAAKEVFAGRGGRVVQPEWTEAYIAGFNEHSRVCRKLDSLESERQRLQEEIDKVLAQRQSLDEYAYLLFGTGRGQLEPAVRRAFRDLGFNCPEPEDSQYVADYDFHFVDNDTIIAIGEVEGTTKDMTSFNKYRQLVERITHEEISPSAKGILVGNPARKTDPAKRDETFVSHIHESNKRYQFCLLPSFELFRIVQYVLNNSLAAEQLRAIRQSILECTSEYRFAPDLIR